MQLSGIERPQKPKPEINVSPKLIIIIFSVIVLIVLAFNVLAVVPAGHRGVLTTFGSVEETSLGEGIHFINPMAKVNDVTVQTQLFEDAASASSDDLQSVSTMVAVNYHVEPTMAWKIYQEIGQSAAIWEAKILKPAVQESVKAVTAEFTAEDLIKKRPEVKQKITDMILNRMAVSYLVVDQVSITDFSFSRVFDDAIEAKVREEQEAQKAENQLKRIEIEQKQKIAIATADKDKRLLEAEAEALEIEKLAEAKAKGIEAVAKADAEAHRLIAAAVTPESLRQRSIERWDGILPKVVGQNSGLLLNLGLEEDRKKSVR